MNKRLALYAHHGPSPTVARHVLFYLAALHRLDFHIDFISNSELSPASAAELKNFCARVATRENSGFDFSMWRHGLAAHDLAQWDELLLTNSSLIGPLQPLAPLWENPALAGCDFWGLTDNNEIENHLQSFFIVFRRPVLQSPRFTDFWHAILPFRDKQQVIRSYEIGLTRWLAEGGFRWRAVFEREKIWAQFLHRRSLPRRARDRVCPPAISGQNTVIQFPDLLLENGMPFLKAALLRETGAAFRPQPAFALLKKSRLPAEILDELRMLFPDVK